MEIVGTLSSDETMVQIFISMAGGILFSIFFSKILHPVIFVLLFLAAERKSSLFFFNGGMEEKISHWVDANHRLHTQSTKTFNK